MSAAVKWHDYLSRALFAARCSRSTSLLRVPLSVLLPFFFFLSFLPFFFFFFCYTLASDRSIDSRGFLHGEEVGNSCTVHGEEGRGQEGRVGRSLKTDPLKFFRRFPRW